MATRRKKPRPFIRKIRAFGASRFGPLTLRWLSKADWRLPYSAVYEELPARARVPEVLHRRTDEWILQLEGSVQAVIDGRKLTLRAGDVAFLPRGTRHRFSTGARPAKALSIFSPPLDPRKLDVEVLS
jgi:mannose-6-phosphate isomerase-like protein (cupin superfamily)